MRNQVIACLSAASALMIGLGTGPARHFVSAATAAETAQTGPNIAQTISGPVTHQNLSIYLIHGASDGKPVPLTLQEALAKGSVEVRETGNVNQLEIENTGTDEVFVQSGDIVKGGRQDRVLTVSLVLPPKSGRMPIGSFCVEQGRWSARGQENVKRFESASAAVPSREAKLAMLMPAKPAEPPATRPSAAGVSQTEGQTVRLASRSASDTSKRQQEVWENVRKTQDKLKGSLGADVNSDRSATSLQLALENQKLKDAQTAYMTALQQSGETGSDVIGFAIAINGKLNSANVYPSNGLFRKMWTKLLGASATEAIGEASGADAGQKDSPPTIEAVQAFLAAAERGTAESKPLNAQMRLETRDGEKALMVDAVRASGGLVHRNYVAK